MRQFSLVYFCKLSFSAVSGTLSVLLCRGNFRKCTISLQTDRPCESVTTRGRKKKSADKNIIDAASMKFIGHKKQV